MWISLNRFNPMLLLTFFILSVTYSATATADSAFVDKIYHPYVLPLQQRFEWRLGYNSERDHPRDNTMSQRIAYGHSVTERVFVERYLLGERVEETEFKLTGYELEGRWMITEQGKYALDFGALFTIQKHTEDNSWVLTAGLLAEKEFGRTSFTANVLFTNETHEQEENMAIRLQYRYRLMALIQPGIELFKGENFTGLGPSFMGIQRFDGKKQLKWEAGFIFGLNNETTDRSFRIGMEYEF